MLWHKFGSLQALHSHIKRVSLPDVKYFVYQFEKRIVEVRRLTTKSFLLRVS